MNLRQFSLALLISALPIYTMAESSVTFNRGDFKSVRSVVKQGETLLRVKLSKSGKAKIRKLNQSYVNKTVHSEIGGIQTNFKLREPIVGDSLEMGPYSETEANAIIQSINSGP